MMDALQQAKMKAAGCRADGNAPATIVLAVLLGCLAISAQCGRVPTDLAGQRGEVAAAAGSPGGDDERPSSSAMAQPVCYKACGNGRCDYCCKSPYMPTICWPTQGQCRQECQPPIRRPAKTYTPTQAAANSE